MIAQKISFLKLLQKISFSETSEAFFLILSILFFLATFLSLVDLFKKIQYSCFHTEVWGNELQMCDQSFHWNMVMGLCDCLIVIVRRHNYCLAIGCTETANISILINVSIR